MFILLYHISVFSLWILTFLVDDLRFFVKHWVVWKLLLMFILNCLGTFCLILFFLFDEVFKFKQIHIWLILQKAQILTLYLILIQTTVLGYLLILRRPWISFFSIAWKFEAIVLAVHFVVFIIVFRKVQISTFNLVILQSLTLNIPSSILGPRLSCASFAFGVETCHSFSFDGSHTQLVLRGLQNRFLLRC